MTHFLNKLFGFVVWAIACGVFSTAVFAAGAERKAYQPGALDFCGVTAVKQERADLTGLGVNISTVCRSYTYLGGVPQNDYRPNVSHRCFEGARIAFHDYRPETAGVSPHATEIAGLFLGVDPNAYDVLAGNFIYEGLTPDASLDVYEFWYFVNEYLLEQRDFYTDIISFSAGASFQQWWTRAFDWLAFSRDIVVVASIGNGEEAGDPVLYPGAGKNCIGVGLLDPVFSDDAKRGLSEYTLARREHSSMGPSFDLRCKPDIVAPGNCIVPDDDNDSGYHVSGNWSSFAVPVAAGSAAMLLQELRGEPERYNLSRNLPQSCLVRALLTNSADKLPYWHKGLLTADDDNYVAGDYVQGCGALNAENAFRTLRAGRQGPANIADTGWDVNLTINAVQAANIYTLNIKPKKNDYLTATLNWLVPFEGQFPYKADSSETADLSLELWAVDAAGEARLADFCDSKRDNLEHIHYRLDESVEQYKLVVKFSERVVPVKTLFQLYALAWQVRNVDNSGDKRWYDLDGNGKVNVSDLSVILENIEPGREYPDLRAGDINMDGLVDYKDINLLWAKLNG